MITAMPLVNPTTTGREVNFTALSWQHLRSICVSSFRPSDRQGRRLKDYCPTSAGGMGYSQLVAAPQTPVKPDTPKCLSQSTKQPETRTARTTRDETTAGSQSLPTALKSQKSKK